MIIKSKTLLLFDPDALKIEYATGLEYSYYIIAYKNVKSFMSKAMTVKKKQEKNLIFQIM